MEAESGEVTEGDWSGVRIVGTVVAKRVVGDGLDGPLAGVVMVAFLVCYGGGGSCGEIDMPRFKSDGR